MTAGPLNSWITSNDSATPWESRDRTTQSSLRVRTMVQRSTLRAFGPSVGPGVRIDRTDDVRDVRKSTRSDLTRAMSCRPDTATGRARTWTAAITQPGTKLLAIAACLTQVTNIARAHWG